MNARFALGILLVATSAHAREVALTDRAAVGTWACGPVTMHGTYADVVVTTRTTKSADHTFVTLDTSVITAKGKPAITVHDRSIGTWRLDGNVVTSVVKKIEFLSSTDPTLGRQEGQKIEDDQLKLKSVFQSRILSFDGRTSRSVPIHSMYKEAVVESTCERL